MAYALSSCLDLSDSCVVSADDDVLCMEQRLLWELEGVRFETELVDVDLLPKDMAYLPRHGAPRLGSPMLYQSSGSGR